MPSDKDLAQIVSLMPTFAVQLDIEFQNINTAENSGNRTGQLSLRIEF